MLISNDFNLKSDAYIRTKTIKKQIVIGSSYQNKNYNDSLWRNHKRLPHFSIDYSGQIYQHFDIKYHSLFLDCDMDDQTITISLDNVGQVFQFNDNFYDIYNNSYKGAIYEQSWKGCEFWQPYAIEQFNATLELCRYLLDETNISKEVVDINVFKQDIGMFKGISYRSNHHIKHYDINPSWEFQKFKNNIENG